MGNDAFIAHADCRVSLSAGGSVSGRLSYSTVEPDGNRYLADSAASWTGKARRVEWDSLPMEQKSGFTAPVRAPDGLPSALEACAGRLQRWDVADTERLALIRARRGSLTNIGP